MVFGRRKKSRTHDDAVEELETAADGQESAEEAPARPGPHDLADIASRNGYVDLGALLIPPTEDLQLRLEVEERTRRVVAVTLDLHGSSLQLQAFAAPKSEGLWSEIRLQIAESVRTQGGHVEEIEGPFGTEIVARVPAQAADGSTGFRVARFLGVDGPRWFLRGVVGGPAVLDREQAAELEDLFARLVVVRGEQPMPPRDLLALKVPAGAQPQPAAPAPASANGGAGRPPLQGPPERGPEITEIG